MAVACKMADFDHLLIIGPLNREYSLNVLALPLVFPDLGIVLTADHPVYN